MPKKFYVVVKAGSKWVRSGLNLSNGSGFDSREDAIKAINARHEGPTIFEYAIVERIQQETRTRYRLAPEVVQRFV